ncbi:probable sodium-coupled neutral amino acid transporter 6 isoform X1 [Cydia amplana]|uniref:probable sodium-coupled neutral amino acid transporter 6 isoform X1 n=1 Tax=Cydia amplana TaxID=1869771 RepID=UPI002FE5A205
MKYPPLMQRLGTPKPQLVSHHSDYTAGETVGGLSVLFTVLCIVDLFGVFPVIALPKSVIACGYYGIPLVLAVFGLQIYTSMLLGRSWILARQIAPDIREKNRYPYAAVAELAFGQHARRLVTFLIDATVFSAGVPNFIVASQSMQLFWWKISGGEVGISYCVWMVILGLLLCPVMWLGSPKDMKSLAVTSVAIVSTVALCVWTSILLDDSSPPSAGLPDQPQLQDLVVAYGIIAFQFDIHPMLLTIQVDMKDSRKINRAVFCGFAFTGALFAVTSALAAHRYGSAVETNILQGIPPSIALFLVALLVTLQLCLSSAVGNSALFQHVEDLLHIPRDFSCQRCLLRSSIVALAVFLGESVPSFDVVMGLVGSTLTGPLMFIFPPLFFLKLCHAKSNLKNLKEQNGGRKNGEFPLIIHNALETQYKTFVETHGEFYSKAEQFKIKWYDICLALLVMSMGLVATAVSTYSSWSDAVSSATFSTPCLYNATAAARSFLEGTMKI